jgi:hypothetical protein
MSADRGCQTWFEKYPHLFKIQTDILKSAGFELIQDVLRQEGRIQFVGRSKVEPGRQLIVAFPQAFPSSAPKIYDTTASKLLLRHHRIDSRQLCLFGFNENRWNATRSVGDALAEAEELISEFKDGNPLLENQSPEPITRAIPYAPETAILVPPPISTFNGFAQLKLPTGNFFGRFIHEVNQKNETRGRGIIFEANFGDKKFVCPQPFSNFLGNSGKEIHGDWFYLQNPPTQEGLSDILKNSFRQCKGIKKAEFYWIALIFPEESANSKQSRLTWLVARVVARPLSANHHHHGN